MAKKDVVTGKKGLALYKDYNTFLQQVGYGRLNGVDITHDGYPLSVKEAKFIDIFIAKGDLNKALKEANISFKAIAAKEYITDEITWRLEQLKKETIADADEIMQFFTRVMRNEEKDQFGLDAPLSERTNAAKELARRVIDFAQETNVAAPEIKVTLNFEGM